MNRYYVMINGKQEGPFTVQEIKSKNLDSSNYAILIGTKSWYKISEIDELSSENGIEFSEPKRTVQSGNNSIQDDNTQTKSDYGQSQGYNSQKISYNQAQRKGMFQKPFSFDGRIRRTEYGLTLIIYAILITLINAVLETNEEAAIIGLAIIPMLWFVFAQGAKRCHDMGQSGWWQLIPFYPFWMIFAPGEKGVKNKYGLNPK